MTQAARAVALLDWLATRHEGACKLEVPEGRFSDASTVLRRFCERGQVGYVMEPGLRGNDRRRYFVRDLCPPGAVLAPLNVPRRAQLAADPEHKPEPRRKPESVDPDFRIAPRQTASEAFRLAEADYSRAKVTVWEPRTDPRAMPTTPAEPLFSAMGPGRYLLRDTAIQLAYGGAK